MMLCCLVAGVAPGTPSDPAENRVVTVHAVFTKP